MEPEENGFRTATALAGGFVPRANDPAVVENQAPRSIKSHDSVPLARRMGAWLFTALVVTALGLGWLSKGEEHLTAESGLGYGLGIAGGVMMLLLLAYSLRKRAKRLRNLGRIAGWFRIHMILGILGPVLVLFHSNFGLGSTNSTVALVTMLVVATSGLVGRFIYTKIHRGLYGSRLELQELRADMEKRNRTFVALIEFAPDLIGRLKTLGQRALGPGTGFTDAARRFLSVGLGTRWAYPSLQRNLARALAAEAKRQNWRGRQRRMQARAARRLLGSYLFAVCQVAEFNLFERLFALWHMLHLPLFFIMFVASVVHVFAVHMY